MEEWNPFEHKLIATVTFPSKAYYSYHDVSDHGDVLQYYFSRDLGLTQVYFEYSLYTLPTKLSFAGVDFDIAADVTKFTLSVKNWPWISPHNTLKVYFSVETNPATVTVSSKKLAPHITAVTYSTTSSDFSAQIELIDRAIVDNFATSQGVNFSFPSNTELVVDLPHFKESIIYDPNLSILVSNGDGSDSLLGLIALAAIPVAVVVVVMVVVAGSLWAWQARRRRISMIDRRLSTVSSNNLDEETYL